MKEKFFSCECYSEGLLLSKYDDEDSIIFAVLSLSYNKNHLNLWERIKYCYHVLKNGKIYKDQLILDNDKAKEIAEWLIEETKN